MKNAYEGMTDQQLVHAYNHSDNNAFKEIYNRYFEILATYAKRFLKDKELAHDAIQDVFTKVSSDVNLDENKSLKAFLFKAVRNRCLNIISRGNNYDAYLQDIAYALKNETAANTPENSFAEKEIRERIEQAISELPTKMREIFIMSRKQYLTNKEIAALKNISEKTVKSHIVHALRILRAKLGAFFHLYLMCVILMISKGI